MSDDDIRLAYFKKATFNNPLALTSASLSGNIIKDLDDMGLSYTKEGYLFLGCAYASAFLPVGGVKAPASADSWEKLVVTASMGRNYVRKPDTTGAAATAGTGAGTGATTPTVYLYDAETGHKPTYVTRGKDEDQFGDFNMENIEHCPDPEMAGILRTVAGSPNDMIGHFLNICAAYQVKGLKATQISSYFASIGIKDVQGSLFQNKFGEFCANMPKIAGDSGLKELLIKNKWMDYRLTFASSLNLIDKMIRECPPPYMDILSDESKALINNALNDKSDGTLYHQIPEKVLAVLYAWQKATNSLPAEFYGPTKAYEALAINERLSLDNWFRGAVRQIKTYTPSLLGDSIDNMPDSLKKI